MNTITHDPNLPTPLEYTVADKQLTELRSILDGAYARTIRGDSIELVRLVGRVQRMVQGIIRGIHRDSVVRWDVGNVGTDHSFIVKGNRWQINLDPARIVYPSLAKGHEDHVNTQIGRAEAEDYLVRIMNVQSIIGAAIHEVAHVLYSGDALTSDFQSLDEDTVAIFRVYEDEYVNARIMYERLPAAMPFFRSAYNWTNDLDTLKRCIAKPVTSFTDLVMNVCAVDYMGDFINEADVTVQDKLLFDLAAIAKSLSAPLREGDGIKWDKRLQIYRDIENALKQALPPQMKEEMDQAKAARKAAGWKNSDTMACDGGGVNLTDQASEVGTTMEVQQAGQTANNKANAAETDGIDLDSLGKPKGEGKAKGEGSGAGRNTNEDVNYERANPNEYPEYVPDKSRVERLRNAFKIRSNVRRMVKHGAPQGRLSMRRVHKIIRPNPSDYVFKERPIVRGEAGVVLLLVDSSGSMMDSAGNGMTHYQVASQAASELWHALRSNPDYKLYFWGFSSHRGGLDIRAATVENGKLNLPKMIDGGTPTHLAICEAAKFLQLNHPTAKKLVVHFTDCDLTMNLPSDWEAVMNDELTSVATVTTVGGSDAERFRSRAPYLNISVHDAKDLPMAVQEICVHMS